MNEGKSPAQPQGGAQCPYCASDTVKLSASYRDMDSVEVGRCSQCRRLLVSVNDRLVYPDEPVAMKDFSNLPADLSRGLAEACSLADVSPNASCALLLSYLEDMCDSLGAAGAGLGEKVADLSAKGKIPEEFASLFHAPIPGSAGQKLDAVRQQAYDVGSLAAYLGPHLPFNQ